MCGDEDCEFNGLLTQLVRAVTVLSIGALLFTSSMIMNVTFGLMTGIGTIDRLKKKANDTIAEAIEEPIPIRDVWRAAFLVYDICYSMYIGISFACQDNIYRSRECTTSGSTE